ncbi:MAG: RNA methyltransferase [Clostridia bacterium]|nr:RNA methyltransferase [Clostridia bacterium]
MTREECIARYRAEELRSRTGATVTMLSKLKDAKYREEYGLYLAEGVKLAEEALAAGMKMEMLFVSEDGLHSERILACLDAADAKRIPIKLATAEVFEKAATEKAPQGIIAVLHRRKTEEPFRDPEARYFLLDTIQDPGNLGTILRSAVAFGADGLILCGCADPTGPKTVRASMGALFRCPVRITKDLGGNDTAAAEGWASCSGGGTGGKQPLCRTGRTAEKRLRDHRQRRTWGFTGQY